MPNLCEDDAVIIAGSTEIPVRARLSKNYTVEFGEVWSGSLITDDGSDLYPLHDNDDLVLRMSDGQEGRFTADWVTTNGRNGLIDVEGMGRAPF